MCAGIPRKNGPRIVEVPHLALLPSDDIYYNFTPSCSAAEGVRVDTRPEHRDI